MNENITLEILTAAEATELLRSYGMVISPETLRCGIEDRRFPFGDYIPTKSGSNRVYVYRKLLDAWIAERAMKKAK